MLEEYSIKSKMLSEIIRRFKKTQSEAPKSKPNDGFSTHYANPYTEPDRARMEALRIPGVIRKRGIFGGEQDESNKTGFDNKASRKDSIQSSEPLNEE